MVKKLLFISNISRNITNFHLCSFYAAEKYGYEFHFAANFNSMPKEVQEKNKKIHFHQIDFIRFPFHPGNIKAYNQLIMLINTEKFDAIHCNTPIGGALGRLCGKRCGVKEIIYTAHGFHFYTGASIRNWLFYFPIERFLAHYTDALITINQEDFERAQKFHMRKKGKVYYVPGVGVDTSQYVTDKKIKQIKREELGLQMDDFALISMGDLIKRKNYPLALEVIAKVNDPRVHYYICGQGPAEGKLRKYSQKLGIEQQVHFLGYRTDIKELLCAADIFLFTTKQEGLARSLMEAMASGLSCVVSRIRGNTDLMNISNGGFLCDSVDDYVLAIQQLISSPILRKNMGKNNLEAIQHFNMEAAYNALVTVYKDELGQS